MYKFCGPYWSDGQWQSSVVGSLDPENDLDAVCRDHDYYYATDGDLLAADMEFVRRASTMGPLGVAMAVPVGIQAVTRAADKAIRNFANTKPTMTKTKTQKARLRGAQQTNSQGGSGRLTTPKRNDSVRAAPVAYATKRTGAKPKMTTRPDGTVTVSHRSFLAPILNTINFETVQVACNPGLVGSFPWLSGLAARYEQYRFLRLRYEYRSVVASATNGVVMMSFDYDAADDAPSSKAVQAQTVPNSEANVWMNNELQVPVDGAWRFVRQSTLASNLDVKTYDMGNLWLSTIYGDGNVGGELYVEFTVELKKPSAGFTPSGRFQCETTAFTAPINLTNATITGVGFPLERLSNLTMRVVSGGEWLLVAKTFGTGLTGAIPAPTFSPQAVANGSVIATVGSPTVGTGQTCVLWRIRANTGDILTFTTAGSGTTITGTSIRASPISYNNYT